MNVELIFLDLISKNDGKWTWYQLERGLNARGLGGQVKTLEEIKSLLNEGLLIEKRDETYPYPLYSITDQGKAWLQNHQDADDGAP